MATRASLLACLLVLVAGGPTTPLLRGARAAFTWEACDGDSAPFKASNVALTPDPPVIGGSVTFTIDAAADRTVEGGTIAMSVNFMGAPIFEGSDDLCTKAACPLAPGPIVIKYVQDLPPVAPPGNYDVTLRAKDAGGAELLCVAVHFSMLPPSALAAGSGSTSGSTSSGGGVEAVAASRRMLSAA